MICDQSNSNTIIIRGRTQTSKRYKIVKKNIDTYFYVPSDNGEYVSIYGEPLARVTCAPYELKQMAHLSKKTYEDDVKVTTKYLIDNYVEIPEEPLRICFMDIEVDDSDGYPDIKKADKMIIANCCYDSFKQKYHSFIVTNDNLPRNTIRSEHLNIYFYETEGKMLAAWIQFMHDMDFDVVLAWNGEHFDYPYIFGRIKMLDMDLETLSPIHKLSYFDEKPKGIAWIDLMEAFKKVSTSQLESYSLDYVSKHFLGEGKIEHEGHVGDLWKNDFDEFVKYNYKDVELMVRLEAVKDIIRYFDTVRRIAFCTWDDVFYNTRVLDSYFLKKARELNIILPHRPNANETDSIEGAIVITPTIGIHHNVAVGDVKSLYPTAILTCNMSPETISINGEIKVGNVKFKNNPRGFIPLVVEDLWNLRQSWKKEMHKYPVHSKEYDKWDNLQTVMKFLLNSIYGALLAPGFRLYKKEIGAAITYFGRKTNEHMQHILTEQGYKIVYGDTDSNMFVLHDCNVEEGAMAINQINDSLDKFCLDNFGSSEYNNMEIEFDKLYSSIFFICNSKGQPVKKRYAGLICAVDGEMINEPYMDMKGFDAKRSDSPAFIRELQQNTLYKILTGENKLNIVDPIRKVRSNICKGNYTIEEIAIPKGMSKTIAEYESKGKPIHITGIAYYNNYCGGNVIREKVKYIYVKDVPKKYPPTHVIAFPEKCPTGFTCDYDHMANVLIDMKFKNIFTSMGWDIIELQNYTLTDFF